MSEIDVIREILQEIEADTPNFIRTGIPENVKSDRVRSLHLRNNEAVQRMLDLMDEDTGTGSVFSGVTNPNQTPPPGNYTVGSYYIQRDAETSGNVALYQYTGIDGIGWWRFENYQNFQTVYGEIPDPNAEPPSGSFQIGDYYVTTTDGTEQGDVLAVWFKISTTPGSNWVQLGETPSYPAGTRALLQSGDDAVLRVWSAKDLNDWIENDIELGKGDTGQPGPPGQKGDPGAPGQKGEPGPDGKTPYIGANGNWWIDSLDTGVAASVDALKIIYDSGISGVRNGINNDFRVPDAYVPGTLKVYMDGLLLSKGNNEDYIELNAGNSNNGARINRVILPDNRLIFEFKIKV